MLGQVRDDPVWRILAPVIAREVPDGPHPNTQTLAGGRCHADVSVAKDRQCPGPYKETS